MIQYFRVDMTLEVASRRIHDFRKKGENVKWKRGLVGCGGKQMYTTVAQNEYCENVKRLLFVDILNISVVFLQVIVISVQTCWLVQSW